MGYRHRNMYYLTRLPGWLRFGYSPGWVGRSPSGLPPTAQWIMQSGLLPQYLEHVRTTTPYAGGSSAPVMPYGTELTKDQEKQMLEQQMKALQSSFDAIKKRLEELSE